MSARAQSDRVLAMLRRGPVTIADTDCQPAADGGDKITRLAARVNDLKRRGYVIRSRRVKLGDKSVAEYSLVASSPAQACGASPADTGRLPAETSRASAGIAAAMAEFDDEPGADWWEAA